MVPVPLAYLLAVHSNLYAQFDALFNAPLDRALLKLVKQNLHLRIVLPLAASFQRVLKAYFGDLLVFPLALLSFFVFGEFRTR